MSAGVVLVIWLLCGIAAAMIGQSKNRSVAGFFFLGLLLGVLGLIIAACMSSQRDDYVPMRAVAMPMSPPGWYSDPQGSGGLRWFDGYVWTPHTAPMSVPAPR